MRPVYFVRDSLYKPDRGGVRMTSPPAARAWKTTVSRDAGSSRGGSGSEMSPSRGPCCQLSHFILVYAEHPGDKNNSAY
jgi:hypothetical protein